MPKSKYKKSSPFYFSAEENFMDKQALLPNNQNVVTSRMPPLNRGRKVPMPPSYSLGKKKTKKIKPPRPKRPKRPYSPPNKPKPIYFSADEDIPRQPIFPIEEPEEHKKTKKIKPPRPKRPKRPYSPPIHSRKEPFKMNEKKKLVNYPSPLILEDAIEPVNNVPTKLIKRKKGSMEVEFGNIPIRESVEPRNLVDFENQNYRPISKEEMYDAAMIPEQNILTYYQPPNEPPMEVQKQFYNKPSLEKKLSHFLKTKRNQRNYSVEVNPSNNRENLPLQLSSEYPKYSNSFVNVADIQSQSFDEVEAQDYMTNFMDKLNIQFQKFCKNNKDLIEEMDHKVLDFCRTNGIDLQREVLGRGLIVGTERFNSNLAIKRIFESKILHKPPQPEMIDLMTMFEGEITKFKKTGKLVRFLQTYRGTNYDDSKLNRYFRFSLFTLIQRNAVNYLRYRNNNLSSDNLEDSLYYCFFPNRDGSIREVDIKNLFFNKSEEGLKELNKKLGLEFIVELKNVQSLMKRGGAAAQSGEGEAAATNVEVLDPSQINFSEMVNVSRTALDSEILDYYKYLVEGFIEFCKNKGDEKKELKQNIIINEGKTIETLNKKTLNLNNLSKPDKTALFNYLTDYRPLLEMMIDLKKGQKVAKISTYTYSKMLTKKIRGIATATGLMENEKEISIEEKLYNYILESFLTERRYQQVRYMTKNASDVKNKLALIFREIISLGLVNTPRVVEKEIVKRKISQIRKILTERPGVKGRKKTKKKK